MINFRDNLIKEQSHVNHNLNTNGFMRCEKRKKSVEAKSGEFSMGMLRTLNR